MHPEFLHSPELLQALLVFDFTSETTLIHNSQLLATVLKQGYETYIHSPSVFQAMQIEAISQNYSWMLGATDAYASLFLT